MGEEREKRKKRVKILCVLTGSRYTEDYVYKLKSMIKRNVSEDIPFSFICYTDKISIKGIACRKTDKRGWWGKIDIFKEKGPCLYLDLDTIIVENIDLLLESIPLLSKEEFLMIKPWKRKGWASGIMGWNGDFSFIQQTFNRITDVLDYCWDQKYISAKLRENKNKIIPVQNFLKIYSYKHHCKTIRNYPKDAQIICFHGRPRPHEVRKTLWVKENWI